MSSIRRLVTKTLLISSCFVVLFLSGFIGSVVAATDRNLRDSTYMQDVETTHTPLALCCQQDRLSGN
jgi:alkaline phosphatase D